MGKQRAQVESEVGVGGALAGASELVADATNVSTVNTQFQTQSAAGESVCDVGFGESQCAQRFESVKW